MKCQLFTTEFERGLQASKVWAVVPGFGLEDQPNDFGNAIKAFLDRSALKSEQQIVPPRTCSKCRHNYV
jgi:hypothetical protein